MHNGYNGYVLFISRIYHIPNNKKMKIEEYTEYFSSLITNDDTYIDNKCRRIYELGMIKSVKHFLLFTSHEYGQTEEKLTSLFTDFIEEQIEEKSKLL